MPGRRRHLSVLLALCALGLGACATHQIRRSALVPVVAPPLSTGQGVTESLVELALGNASTLRSATPVEAEGAAEAGLYLPRSQLALQALFAITRDFSLGPKLEIGLYQGAEPIARDIPPPPDSPVIAFGPSMQYSFPLFRQVRLALGMELLWAIAPYAVYESCPTCHRVDSGTDSVAILDFFLIPSVRLGMLTLFAGVSGRNQPTNVKDEEVLGSTRSIFDSDNVTFGRMYLLTFAGLEVRPLRHLALSVEIYYPVTQGPVAYGGPALSAWLTVPLGEGPGRRRPPPPSPPPAVYPPPPAPAPPASHPPPTPPAPPPTPPAPPPPAGEPEDIQ